MVMEDNYIQGILTQTIKIYDYVLVSDGPGSKKSGRSGVGFATKRRRRGGLASNSDIVPGDATEVGCGECVRAFNAFNPAIDPATNTLWSCFLLCSSPGGNLRRAYLRYANEPRQPWQPAPHPPAIASHCYGSGCSVLLALLAPVERRSPCGGAVRTLPTLRRGNHARLQHPRSISPEMPTLLGRSSRAPR
jgi:hypothetical protein